jgi:hypothetical protein
LGVLPFEEIASQLQLSTLWRGVIVGATNVHDLDADQQMLTKALDLARIPYTFEPIDFKVVRKGQPDLKAAVLMVAPVAD